MRGPWHAATLDGQPCPIPKSLSDYAKWLRDLFTNSKAKILRLHAINGELVIQWFPRGG